MTTVTRSAPVDPTASGTGHRAHVTIDACEARRRAALAAIATTPDPVAANRLITRAHHELGHLLAAALGEDTGPNFHTWAVWGSREAGRTIARHDVVGLTPAVTALGALVGAALGWWGGTNPFVIAVLMAIPFAGMTRLHLARASTHIAHGNRIVIEEIGAATIGFLAAIERERAGDRRAVDRFLSTLAPGATEAGGQQLLRRAFAAYAQARDEGDRARRHQLVFAGNCFAVRHEHIRLQHDISRSMPAPLARAITKRLLDFWVGDEHLHVGRDLTPAEPGRALPYPVTLQTLTVADARAAVGELRDPRRAEGSLARSAASDWTVLAQRMDYVVELFRTRHLAPGVFDAPYPDTAPDLFAS
jgi:hypothetical protein